MKILALDTASAQCSVALLVDASLVAHAVATARDHAQLLLPMVDRLLAESGQTLRGLDGIAFGRGPGSFTGVRIAAAVTQGLAAGAGLPVMPVSDLRALAEGARLAARASAVPGGGWLLACMDARMGELYWGLYADTGQSPAAMPDSERLTSPAGLEQALLQLPPDRGVVVAAAGKGLAAAPAVASRLRGTAALCLPDAEPHARDIASLAASDLAAGARWLDPHAAQPVYLRDRVVQVPL
jgi:tRNA threonylcarbamoyladenosine biosynthesis protein TsaB